MLSRELGFSTSWRMLTHERGWIIPLCLLALVGWIPILGQIAVFGYAYEWARFTAWGIDTAPKRRNVDYGKVLATGGRAFLVFLLMGMIVRFALAVFGFSRIDRLMRFLPMGSGLSAAPIVDGITELSLWGVIALAVGLVLGTFLMAAMMRATLYDSFAAGWRVDRLFQMIARDPGGFLKTWLVSLAGGALSIVYTLATTALGGALAFGGFVSYARHGGIAFHLGHGGYPLEQLSSWGAGPIIFAVLLLIAAAFFYGVVCIAMQMVAINAMGQWFCRFEVARWGVSADPLPEGVPADRGGFSSRGGAGTAPVPPGSAQGDDARAGAAPTEGGSYWDDDSPVAG